MIGNVGHGIDSPADQSDGDGVNDRGVASGDHAEAGPGEKNRSRVELLAPRLIELALTAAEKVALSKGNLCTLRKKGQHVVSKTILLEHLEALTGLSPDSDLDPAHRGDRGFVDLSAPRDEAPDDERGLEPTPATRLGGQRHGQLEARWQALPRRWPHWSQDRGEGVRPREP